MEYSLVGTDDPNCFPHHLDKQVGSLTFRWRSPMKVAFAEFLRHKRKARVVLLSERGEPGKVLAWGCYVWRRSDELSPSGEPCDPDMPEIMLYVRRGYRRAGLARQVFWALRHTLGGPHIPFVYYPHDPKSAAFYQKRVEERAISLAGGVDVLRPQVTWLTPP